jgi:hypothetical protein
VVTVISRFRVRDGREEEVRKAFLNRPRLVEKAAGFCGLEVFTDAADPSVFRLLTCWTDEASSRAAFTFIIFAFEITRDYNSILPLMLVTVIADAIAVRYAKNSIMTEKLARRGLHIGQDYEADVLHRRWSGKSCRRNTRR